MGLLVNGEWKDNWYDTKSTKGEFKRPETSYRDFVGRTVDAAGDIKFPAEAGRYHLYVAAACPWAHRTLIARRLKGLEDVISVSMVETRMPDDTGWVFGPAPHDDDVNGLSRLSDVYVKSDANFTGRVTVPVLWDKKANTIVNNESAEIIRILNSEFNEFGDARVDLCPADLESEIDEVNARVYEAVNNGVYRCGFATTQDAYEKAYADLFSTLDWLEERLSTQRFLVGAKATEADWRLFTTLVRFDAVYFSHFKCNRQRIGDFEHLSGYLRELYQTPGIADTIDFQSIKEHYFWSHTSINPHRIVPVGPTIDLDKPHLRDKL